MLGLLLPKWYDTWVSFQNNSFWFVIQTMLSSMHVLPSEFVLLVSDTDELKKIENYIPTLSFENMDSLLV